VAARAVAAKEAPDTPKAPEAPEASAAPKASSAPVDVYNVLMPGEGETHGRVFSNYFSEFMSGGAPRPATGTDFVHHYIPSDEFFAENTRIEDMVTPGSVVIISDYSFEDATTKLLHAKPQYRQSRILSSPRLMKLAATTVPLQIILPLDQTCAIDFPNTTHHVLYRTMWCSRYHDEWLASKANEERADEGVWPWLRSFPFGTSFENGILVRLSADRRPPDARGYLFNYRASDTYDKPTRRALIQRVRDDEMWSKLKNVSETLMRHAPPRPARFLFEPTQSCVTIGLSNSTGEQVSRCETFPPPSGVDYLDLLRDSVFTLAPAGDMFETYRFWEAMEAGSIPIVDGIETDYKGCGAPVRHLLAETPHALALSSADELPELLAREAAEPGALRKRQQQMLTWLDEYKHTTRNRALETASRMRASVADPSRWRPRTTCHATALSAGQVAQQRSLLADYWRQPQNWTDRPEFDAPIEALYSPRNFSSSPVPTVGEWCFSAICAPPLVAAFTCGPVAAVTNATSSGVDAR
jgi:hypothetical protein